MNILARLRSPLVRGLAAALLLARGAALAQVPPPSYQPPPAQAQAVYTEAQLDQMLAPIALYPDALLSQILMAATYPLQVVEAARWSRAHPGLQGDDAVRAVEGEDWDPSVTSLLAFPDVLQRMDQDPQWTQALGDAFLMQEPQVMQEIQVLRSRAQAAGQLYSDSHLRVADEAGVIAIEPVNPQVIYVPYYDPVIVYGTWWWPSYPPVVWAPWPGYVAVERPGVHVAFFWGTGIRVATHFFFGAPEWHHRRVNVVNVNTFYYRPEVAHPERRIYTRVTPGPWQHDPWHRRGIGYRSRELSREYGPRQPPSPVSPARRMQLQQERRTERRQASPVSPARQLQLQQKRQFERRQERANQPSPARQMQQQRPQFQAPPGRAADPRPPRGGERKDSRPHAKPEHRRGDRGGDRDRGPGPNPRP